MISDVPSTWASPKLEDICQINPREKPSFNSDDKLSFVPMAAVSEISGSIANAEVRTYNEVRKGFTPFGEGDVLFAKITPCMENGKAAIARNLVNQFGFGSTEFHVLRPSSLLLAEWIYAIIRSKEFRTAAEGSFQGAAGQRRVPAAFLEKFRVPLPPLSEQQRIVDILQEAEAIRRLRAEAEEIDAELVSALFHDNFKNRGKHEFKPLHKLADVVSGVALGRKMSGHARGVPYLRVANVQAGYLDLNEVKTTMATDEEIARFRLKNGDVLMTEGGDYDKLGRGCLWEGQVDPCIHQNHIFRVRPTPYKLDSHFFTHYLQSVRAKNYFLRCAKKTTNLASINLTQLKSLPVPNIPLDKQREFKSKILIARSCGTLESDQSFCELKESLAAHAFSGRLTAQWREIYKEMLAHEIADRDAALKKAGAVQVRRRGTVQEMEELLADFTEGIHSELNREQRLLVREIGRMVGGVSFPRYFTARTLGDYLKEQNLAVNPHAIEGHLAVLAARGIIIPVSREVQTEDTGEYVFGNAYRLPLRAAAASDADGDESAPGDDARLRELERLADLLRRKR